MAQYLFYFLLGIYCIALVASLIYYLSRRAPAGDASVGWAIGFFYMVGLAVVILVAWLLRAYPLLGLIVLSFPLLYLALPRLRYARTELYTRFPTFADTPQLHLGIENNTGAALRIRLECWFGPAKSHSASLHTSFDFDVAPWDRKHYLLSEHQTRLLAHKSKYVSILTYELATETHDDHSYIREIQPCIQFYDEKIEAFRSGIYTIVVNPIPF